MPSFASWEQYRGPDGSTVRAIPWHGGRQEAARIIEACPGAKLVGHPRSMKFPQPDGSTLVAWPGYWVVASAERVLPCHPDHFASVHRSLGPADVPEARPDA